MLNLDKRTKTKPKPHSSLRTAHTFVPIIVHHCRTQLGTEQFG